GAVEDAGDSLECVRDVGRMQRSQNQMAGFGGGEGGGDGFVIAHLADDDHVRVLAQHVNEGTIVTFCVGQNFLLHNNRAFVAMDELDRVFDGDDFATALVVDQIDHV